MISTQAAGCDWDQLLDAHGRDFEALFGQVNDATLQEATSAAVRKSTSASGRPGGIIYYFGRLDAVRLTHPNF